MTVVVIVLGVFAALMTVAGFKRGFFGRIIALVCMILAFGLMIFFAPLVKSTITEKTGIDEKLEEQIEQRLEKTVLRTDSESAAAVTVRETLEKTAHNTAMAVITAVSYFAAFALMFVILELICSLIFGSMKNKNKVVKGTDAVLGGVLGLAEALLIIEGLFLLLKLMSGIPAVDTFISDHLTKSAALSFIYQHNLLDFLNSLRYNSYS